MRTLHKARERAVNMGGQGNTGENSKGRGYLHKERRRKKKTETTAFSHWDAGDAEGFQGEKKRIHKKEAKGKKLRWGPT